MNISTPDALHAALLAQVDEPYRAFSARLLPPGTPLLGVRLPVLRRMAAELAAGDWRRYLCDAWDTSMEEVMLQGMTLGAARATLAEKAPYIAAFLPKIQNWSVCDSFCASLKDARREPEAMLALVDPLLDSEKTVEARFACVMLLMYFMDAEHLPDTLARLERVHAQGADARKGVAWALSIAYRTNAQMTLTALPGFDADIRRMALQKMIELAGTNADQRAQLRALRSAVTKPRSERIG